MKILFLYNKDYALPLGNWLEEQGHEVVYCTKPVSVKASETAMAAAIVAAGEYDLAVSYSYRYLVPGEVIDALKGNIVNLHISMLPFNRGANPNEWSFLDGTPQGVTIHYMDEKLDKGRILAQRTVCFDHELTLAQCYNHLHEMIQELFRENFAYYEYWTQLAKLPVGKGTYHSVADFKPYETIWNNREIRVSEFLERAKDLAKGGDGR